MHGAALRLEARSLREGGWPYRRIARELGVSVASAHRWTSDIELSEAQREHNRSGPTGPQNPAHIALRAKSWSAACRTKRLAYQADGRERARATHDPLHMVGCMLYWAEGAKNCNALRFSNSDVDMTAVFCRFLRESLTVPEDQIRLSLNVYTNNGLSIAQIEQHWLDALELPASCVRKHMLNHTPTSSSGRSRRRLVYGVATLVVTRTWAVQHVFGAIQQYIGIDRPEWVETSVRAPPATFALSSDA